MTTGDIINRGLYFGYSITGGIPILNKLANRVFAPNYNFYIILEDDACVHSAGYEGGDYVFMPLTGRSHLKTELATDGRTLRAGEMNTVFLERETLMGKTIRLYFVPCVVKFHQSALDEIGKVDKSKMLDRTAERINYSGEMKWKVPMTIENIVFIVMVGAMLLMFFWVLISNFGSLVSPIAGAAAAQHAAAVANATVAVKPPILAGG
jgi:hypothetical protein